jgi:SAM-dependent methyltransferase
MFMTEVTPFEAGAAEYDAWFDRHADLYQAEFTAVRSLLPAGGDGVEIGVGTGRFAVPLGITVGVEPSPTMAELARQRGIEVHKGVAEDLPFADGSVDYAVMVTVVCFLDDVVRTFREVFRVLKPAGSLIVAFIDRESLLGRQYQQRKDRSQFYRDATFYSAAQIERFLRNAGFSGFDYRQTLLADTASALSVLEGHGRGGFVVIRAGKGEKGGTA